MAPQFMVFNGEFPSGTILDLASTIFYCSGIFTANAITDLQVCESFGDITIASHVTVVRIEDK